MPLAHRPPATVSLARLAFLPPDRSGLPPLARYGHVRMPDGELRIAGEVEQRLEQERRASGVPLHPAVLASLRSMCEELEIEYEL